MPIRLNGKIVWNKGENFPIAETAKINKGAEDEIKVGQIPPALPQTYSGTSSKTKSSKTIKAGGNAVL